MKRFVMAAVISGLALAATPTIASAAVAPDPSGSDPAITGCASTAVTIARRPIVDIQGHTYGYAEVRWSPSCQTNWVRALPTPGLNGEMEKYIFRGKGYYPAGGSLWATWDYETDPASASSYSMQVYSPTTLDNQCVSAYVKYKVNGAVVAATVPEPINWPVTPTNPGPAEGTFHVC